jgi:PAS domain S-box-containing protein
MAMRVGELARRTGVGVSTLRAWEGRFSFPQPQRSDAGHRLYSEEDIERVQAVVRLVAEGLTLPAAITRVARVGPGALPDGEAEALLHGQILEAAEQGIWVSKEGRTRYANRRMAELMNTSVDVLIATPVLEFFRDEDLPVVKERTQQVRTGTRLHFTTDLRRPDGSTFLAEITTTPMFDPVGRYDGAVAIVSDIGEQHDIHEIAILHAAILDAVGEVIPEAVAAATPDGTVVYVNRAAERMFGWRSVEIVGRDGRDLLPAPEASDEADRIHTRLVRGHRFSGRLTMARRDGTQFVAHLDSEPAYDHDGTLLGLVGIYDDPTERDRLDHKLRTREQQVETLALLGAQALRQRGDPRALALMITEALEATRRLLGADHLRMFDVLVATDELRLRAASPHDNGALVLPQLGRTFAGYIAIAAKAVVLEHTKQDVRSSEWFAASEPRTESAVGAPIVAPTGVIGALIAESARPGSFDRVDSDYLQSVANILGAALLTV